MSETKIKLTQEMKQGYIDVIHKIWPNVLNRYSADDVTEEVAEIIDTVLNSITNCSNGMALVHELFEDFYMPFKINKWRTLIKEAFDVFSDWLDALEENRKYKVCVTNAAWQWRSVIEMALMGL